jgi:hypothetical protein
MDTFGWVVAVAVVLIAALYAYRNKTAAQTLARRFDSSHWFNQILAKLRELRRGEGQPDLEWAADFLNTGPAGRDVSEWAEQFLDAACAAYLRGGDRQRGAIRRLFGKDSWWPLLEFAETKALRIKSPSDVESLREGLAAASIAGLRVDYRDFLVCLGELYSGAESAGIDPLPYFKEVAELSDKEPISLKATTADLIGDFHNTDYFKELSGKKGRAESG